MIKNYKQYNEGIVNLLVGPTEEEIIEQLKDQPLKLFKIGCEEGYLDMVKYSIENSYKDANLSIYELNDGLRNTAENGYIDIFKYLIDNYEVNWKQLSICGTLFAMNNNVEMMKYITENGYEPNDMDLCSASGWVRYEMVKYLLSLGVNIHVEDDRPLQLAVNTTLHNIKGFDVVKLLLDNGAIPNEEVYKISSKNEKIKELLKEYNF